MRKYFTKENRALMSELVRTDFKLRYQGSLIGYAWSLLKPLLVFIILYVVFVYFLKVGKDINHFPVYLLLGIVMWNFFTEMTTQSLGAIVARGDLIRKIKIPRWLIIVSTSVSAVINFFLSMLIVLLFMYINGVGLNLVAIFTFPLYFAMMYVLALGMSLLLSAMYVKYRDVSYIWEVVLQAGFYATPIIYPLQMIQNPMIEKLLLLNPAAMAIQGARHDLINQEQTLTTTDVWIHKPAVVLIPLGVVLAALIIGVIYFKKSSEYFAENI